MHNTDLNQLLQDVMRDTGKVQQQAADAVQVMEQGMGSMEEGLSIAEQAAGENAGQSLIVEKLFATIHELTDHGRAHVAEASGVAEVAEAMRALLSPRLHSSLGLGRAPALTTAA